MTKSNNNVTTVTRTKSEDGKVIETHLERNEFGVSTAIFSEDEVKFSVTPLRARGFKVVSDEHRTCYNEINLPVRADPRSAGYDFYLPSDIIIPSGEKISIFSDVKSYMQPDEYLTLVPRSSAGIKLDIMFSNTIGIIDSSYYENPDNDGNIGFSFRNMGNKDISLKAGERIGQGIFMKYLLADNDEVLNSERVGGSGSSGK